MDSLAMQSSRHKGIKGTHPIFARVAVAVSICLLCLLTSAQVPSAIAHALGQSYLYFQIGEDTINVRSEITVQDLNDALQLGLPSQKKVPRRQIEPHLEQIKTYVASHLEIGSDTQAYRLVFQKHEFFNTSFAQYLLLDYAVEGFTTLPDSLQINYDVILAERSQHTNLVVIQDNWKTGTFANESNVSLIFTHPGQKQTLNIASGSLLQGFVAVVKLGIEHILVGIDHVLFLVALLMPSVLQRQNSHWQPVSRFSTAFIYIIKLVITFSIAYSLTLALAAFQVINIPSRLVESVIAASIGLAVVDIFYPLFKKRIWWIIFIFGLFHGFGFAHVLGKLGVMSQHSILSWFGFNLGVEIGQIAIIAVLFPLLYLVRKQGFYRQYVLKIGGLLLGAVSLYWFIERALDVNLQILPMIQKLFGILT